MFGMSWKRLFVSVLGCNAVRVQDDKNFVNIGHETATCEPVKWRLCDDQNKPIEFTSNLNGAGPLPGPDEAQEFRMKEVADMNGKKLDLVVMVAAGEDYKSFIQEKEKGPKGAYVSPCPSDQCKGKRAEPQLGTCWSIIPWRVTTHTKFHFKWVETGTSKVFDMGKFDMSFYDLDHEPKQGVDNYEYLEFVTPVSSSDHGPRVEQSVTGSASDPLRIQSKEDGTFDDNVVYNDPAELTDNQIERKVHVTYENLGEWYITFGHWSSAPEQHQASDRVVEISGMYYPCQPCDKPPPCKNEVKTWRLCNDQNGPIEFTSNLANKGPGVDPSQEFRMKEIAEVTGKKLDLVVTVAADEDYASHIQNNKGPKGAYVSPCPSNQCKGKRLEPQTGTCWSIIPWKVTTKTKFHFKWVETGTTTVFGMGKFDMSFYDLDHEPKQGVENYEYLEFITPVSSSDHGPKVQETASNPLRIQSLEQGEFDDNVVYNDPAEITDVQNDRKVHVAYENVGEWYITFGHHSSAPEQHQTSDRVVEFTGTYNTCV